MNPLFLSFIVPVYNAQQYLAECLNSLLAQDLPRDAYEILCVNDGSTDHSAEILDAYQMSCQNLRVIHQENSGVVTARNVGLEQARGDFIWFVDADDLVAENLLGALRALTQGQDRVVMDGYTFTDVLSLEEQEQAQAGTLPCNVPWYDSVVWRCILRREFLLDHNLTFRYPELTHGEDGMFMYEVAAEAPRTAQLKQTGYFYRVHSGSAETGVSPLTHRRKLRSYLKLVEALRDHYQAGRTDTQTANKLMSYLWLSLYEIAQLPAGDASAALQQLQTLGMFPCARLPECTLESSYLVSQEGPLGKLLDKICQNLHTRWGYTTLRMIFRATQRIRN